MADNYIEKQYDNYAARKAAWEKGGVQKSKPEPPKQKKRLFLTGGAEGIGRAILQSFCQEGYKVAFCDINEKAGRLAALQTGATFYKVDVTCVDELEAVMKQLFEAWGDIDVIVNNVGVSGFVSLAESTVDDFDRVLHTNLRPVFVTSRLLAIHRTSLAIPNAYGRIINIGSTRSLMSEAGSEGYAASKGGIHSLTHALALSLSELSITVNCVSPGWIQNCAYDALRPEDHAQHPSKRVGKPDDIARMVLFLCQEGNDFINGETLTVDGGMTKKMIYVE
ncbi:MAG: SDR family NAD(P)-dependent oxidoreductase [Phocaeicola sp.]